ncbi:MAG: hypothetical protein ACP5QR_13995 [Rhizomicrobium sp.]
MGIDTPKQRDVLNRAKAFAEMPNASLCDPTLRLDQAKRKYYRVMRACGITLKTGHITSHGLRHSGANDRYEELTGKASPVRGGGPVDPERDEYARRIVAEELGHSRPHITTHYIGRYRRNNTAESI